MRIAQLFFLLLNAIAVAGQTGVRGRALGQHHVSGRVRQLMMKKNQASDSSDEAEMEMFEMSLDTNETAVEPGPASEDNLVDAEESASEKEATKKSQVSKEQDSLSTSTKATGKSGKTSVKSVKASSGKAASGKASSGKASSGKASSGKASSGKSKEALKKKKSNASVSKKSMTKLKAMSKLSAGFSSDERISGDEALPDAPDSSDGYGMGGNGAVSGDEIPAGNVTEAPTMAPSEAPSEAPISEIPVEETDFPTTLTPTPDSGSATENVECSDAIRLELGDTVTGKTIESMNVNRGAPECPGVELGDPRNGAWFRFRPQEDTPIAVVVLGNVSANVYEGPNCNNLVCIDQSTSAEEGTTTIMFTPIAGERHYIFIYSEREEEFELDIEEMAVTSAPVTAMPTMEDTLEATTDAPSTDAPTEMISTPTEGPTMVPTAGVTTSLPTISATEMMTESPTESASTATPTMEETVMVTESPTAPASTDTPTIGETVMMTENPTQGVSTDFPLVETLVPTAAQNTTTNVTTDTLAPTDSETTDVVIVPSLVLSFGFFELAEKREPVQAEIDELIVQTNSFYAEVLAANFTNYAIFEADGKSYSTFIEHDKA